MMLLRLVQLTIGFRDSGVFESRLKSYKVESSFKVKKGTLFVGEWPRLKI